MLLGNVILSRLNLYSFSLPAENTVYCLDSPSNAKCQYTESKSNDENNMFPFSKERVSSILGSGLASRLHCELSIR